VSGNYGTKQSFRSLVFILLDRGVAEFRFINMKVASCFYNPHKISLQFQPEFTVYKPKSSVSFVRIIKITKFALD
jgi:hypothetical protein